MKPQDWLRFVQIPPFPNQWDRLRLNDEDMRGLEVCLMAGPTTGAMVPGTNGLRKCRYSSSRSGRGKSGSYRVYYVYFAEHGIVMLMAIISKSEKSDLTKADRNALAKVIERLERLLDQRVIR